MQNIFAAPIPLGTRNSTFPRYLIAASLAWEGEFSYRARCQLWWQALCLPVHCGGLSGPGPVWSNRSNCSTDGPGGFFQTDWQTGFSLTLLHKQSPSKMNCIQQNLQVCMCVNLSSIFDLQAKVDNEILDYKDLAAIPKVKAIYDIERPDLITYEPFYTTAYEERQERQSLGEVMTWGVTHSLLICTVVTGQLGFCLLYNPHLFHCCSCCCANALLLSSLEKMIVFFLFAAWHL